MERFLLPAGLKVADAALVLLTLYGLGRAWRTRQRLVFPLLVPMWLILVASLCATLVGMAPLESFMAIVQEIYLFTWFIVLANTLGIVSVSERDRLMKIWSVVALAEATTTMMGMLRIGPSMFYTLPFGEMTISTTFSRGIGTYANANAAAIYLSVSFFVLLATSWPIWIRCVLGLWIFGGMFATGSIGGLLSTLIGLGVLVMVLSIIQNRRTVILWGAILGMGVGLIAVILPLMSLLSSLLSNVVPGTSDHLLALTVGRSSRSLAGRLEILGYGWQFYRLHPLGTGPNVYFSLRGSLHNDYTAFLFERGPLGLVGWLWLVGAALLVPLQIARQLMDRHQRWQVLALDAGLLACFINAFSHEVSHMRQVWVLMVFLFAACYTYLTRPASPCASLEPNQERNWNGPEQAEPGRVAKPTA
jgi:hypothetical protein